MIETTPPIPRNINAGNKNEKTDEKLCLEILTYVEVFNSKDLQFFLPDKLLKLFGVQQKATLLNVKIQVSRPTESSSDCDSPEVHLMFT